MAGAGKTVIVTLDPETSAISVDAIGFHGKGCDAIHNAFNALGEVTKSVKKPEYKATNVNLVRK